jgi:hypothetical protein
MDDGGSLVIVNDTHLEWFGGRRRADVHRDGRIVGLERSPVVAYRVQHVDIGDTVLAGARLDVHHPQR